MDKLERILSEKFRWYEDKYYAVRNFRYITEVGAEAGKRDLYLRNLESLQWSLDNGLLKDTQYFKDKKDEMALAVTNRTIQTVQLSLEAATIIFVHTILDTLVNDLCKLTKEKYPERWDRELYKYEVTYKEIITKGIDKIRMELINDRLKQLERSSLLDRTDFLFRHCRIGEFECMKGYKFDRQRIKVFDALRHSIIHNGLPIDDLKQEIEKDMDYLYKTGLYLLFMLTKSYEVKLIPEIMFSQLK